MARSSPRWRPRRSSAIASPAAPPATGARAAAADLELSTTSRCSRAADLSTGLRAIERRRQRATPLYRRLLGAAWNALPAPLQAMHDLDDELDAEGMATVERGKGLLARLIACVDRLSAGRRECAGHGAFSSVENGRDHGDAPSPAARSQARRSRPRPLRPSVVRTLRAARLRHGAGARGIGCGSWCGAGASSASRCRWARAGRRRLRVRAERPLPFSRRARPSVHRPDRALSRLARAVC